MIRGITFDKQLMKSKDNAHEVNFYYSGDLGVTKGCGVSVNASNDIVVAEGYFIIKGRLVSIEGSETIDVPTVPSGTLYSIAVFEIDLTKTNTTTAFNQGSFKILSNASAYPTLTQQDLDNGGTIYQFEFARFENTVAGLVNFSDTRVVLEMTKYATKAENALKAPLASPTFTGTVSGITKAMVGLENVDNTSDENKPVSTAQQTQINTRQLKNWIINGGFDVWQRGTSQTSSGYGSDDRWINNHATSTKTHSRQAFTLGQTSVPNNPTYFSRTVVTSVAGASNFARKMQAIEDVTKLAGKTVSLSFWAKADSSKNMSIEFVQNFGSTGTNSIGVQKFALTNTWQRFTKTLTLPSISGKTIDGDTNLILYFWFDAGSNYNSRTDSLGQQSGTFDIANVSLVEGSVPVEWQTEAYADVLRECQRYFFPIITLEGNTYMKVGVGFATDTTNVAFMFNFPVPMRRNPTITTNDATKFWCTDGITTLTLTALSSETNTTSMVRLTAQKTNSFTQYRAYLLERSGNNLGYIWADAEL